MKRPLVIAHAKGEEDLAELLAAPLCEHGYEPMHLGTIFIGDSMMEEASRLLAAGAPVILCATARAIGTKWARQLANAARSSGIRVFAMQMDEDADIELLALGDKYGTYWQSPEIAIRELVASLLHYYPVDDTPDPSVGVDLAIRKYYAELKKRYQRLDLDSLTPRQRMDYMEVLLRSVYVEQTVRNNPPPVEFPKEVIEQLRHNKDLEPGAFPEDIPLEEVRRISDVYYKEPPIPVLQILAKPANQHTVILGDPGAGKSTLTRYIILSMIDGSQDNPFCKTYPGYLPLLIELKSYAGLLKKDANHKNFLDYFEYLSQTEGHYIGKEYLHQLLSKDGKAIVIFDGLDEIFEPDERDQIARHIDKFKETYPATRIIVTSRIVGFRRKILSDAGFNTYTLQDLDEPRIREFAEKWYTIVLGEKAAERTELIMRAIRDSDSIRQLAGNPLLLTIMAILAKSQELPRERWKLYDHAASVLIEIWDVNKYLAEKDQPAEYMDEEDKKEMLQRIAFKMQTGQSGVAGNYITGKELQLEFESYITDRYKTDPFTAKRIAVKMIQQLHERNFILSLYGANLYGFVHRAFLEYFCALSIVRKFQNTHQLSLDQLKEKVFGAYCFDQSWHEVLRLVAGMIEAEFAGEIIDYLGEITLDPQSYQAQIDQGDFVIYVPAFSPWNWSLALKCLGEIRKIHLLASPANMLLSRIRMFFDWDMFNPPKFFSFFKEDILPYARLIGPSWPGKDRLAEILRYRLSLIKEDTDSNLKYSYIYDQVYGSFIGYIGKGSEAVHTLVLEYAIDKNERIRVSAPFALAVGWHDDPLTLPLLCQLANSDPHQTVCYAAIYALAEHYSDDPEIFELIKTAAISSHHGFGRAAAITGLATHYRQEPGVFEILQECSLQERNKFPRTVSVKALGEYFRDRPQTFQLLVHAAKNDKSPTQKDEEHEDPYYVRDAAIVALFRHWPDHPETVILLLDRASLDPSPWLKKKAKNMLKQLSQRKP